MNTPQRLLSHTMDLIQQIRRNISWRVTQVKGCAYNRCYRYREMESQKTDWSGEVLFEDELHDHGISSLSMNIRGTLSSFFFFFSVVIFLDNGWSAYQKE